MRTGGGDYAYILGLGRAIMRKMGGAIMRG